MNEPRGRDRASFALLGALVLALFAPPLLRGETFLALDNLLAYLPWSSPEAGFLPPGAQPFRPHNPLITDPVNGLLGPVMHALQAGLAQGELPFWNPRVLGGVVQPAQSNPLEYLAYGLLPLTVAHDALLALYLLAAGAFSYFFLRELGLGAPAARLGAVAWMGNGTVAVWLEFEWSALCAASLAATFFFIERLRRTRSAAARIGLVAAAGFTIAADFVQILVYVWLLAGAWILYACRPAGGRSLHAVARREVLPLALAFLASLPLAANTLASGSVWLEGAQRESIAFGELFARTGQLPLESLRTFLFPDFYGNPTLASGYFTPRPGPGFPYNNYLELCLYAGVAPLLLALVSLAQPRRRPTAFFAAGAALALWMAAGGAAYAPIAWIFPGLDLTTPTRVLFAFGFCVSVLAALGLEALLAGGARARAAAALACGALAAAAGAVAWQVQSPAGIARAVHRSFDAAGLRQSLPALREHFALEGRVLLEPLILLALACALVLALAFLAPRARRALAAAILALTVLDLGAFCLRFNTTAPRALAYPETGAIRFLRGEPGPFRVLGMGRFLHSGLAAFDLEDAGGYASFFSRRWAELLFAADVPGIASSASDYGVEMTPPGEATQHADHVRLGSPLVNLLGVRYVLTAPSENLASLGLELAYDGESRAWRNPGAFPRAFFTPGYRLAADPADAWRALREASASELRERVLLESPPPGGLRDLAGGVSAAPNARVRIFTYGADRIELEVDSAAPGFVVIADAYHPAWRARVNGRAAEVLPADWALRAVGVEAGRSRVELEFRPPRILVGLVVAALGWAALGLAAFTLAARALRRTRLPGAAQVPRG
jgi:hypothetical protein